MQRVLQVIGVDAAGKTTVAELLLHEMAGLFASIKQENTAPLSLLLLDASVNSVISKRFQPEGFGTRTVSSVFADDERMSTLASPMAAGAGVARERVDWLFSELPVSVGNDIDLITLGALPFSLPEWEQDVLTYGLGRLMEPYDYVVVDGWHPLLEPIIKHRDVLRQVVVRSSLVAEGMEDECSENILSVPGYAGEGYGLPALVLNRLPKGAHSDLRLEKLLSRTPVRLVARLEECQDTLTRETVLAKQFQGCLSRLDLPVHASR